MCNLYFVSEQVPYIDDMGDIIGIEAVKIGFTSDCVHKRISQLQTGNLRKLHVVRRYSYESTEMAKQMERLIHFRLKDHRINGEWFEFNGHTRNVFSMLDEYSYDFECYSIPYELELAEASNG